MLIRAMVREKLGSPVSSPKRRAVKKDEESQSPGNYGTPKKKKYSPFGMLQRNDLDFESLHTP
jgi:hypothetical protein